MTLSSVAWNVAAESVILPPVRDLNDGFKIRRALPSAQRRIVGPFIILHHFEPIMFCAGAGPNADPCQARSKSRARPGRFAKPSLWSSNLARRPCRPREVAPMSCWSVASLPPSLGTSTGVSCRARRTASSRPRTIGVTVAFPPSLAKWSSSRCCLTGCAIPLIVFSIANEFAYS
jgi:hypothetical protein